MAMVSSTDFVRASERTTAIATLNRQRHLTPSCGGFTPTAKRTVGPARMIVESLTARPGIREQYRHFSDLTGRTDEVRLWGQCRPRRRGHRLPKMTARVTWVGEGRAGAARGKARKTGLENRQSEAHTGRDGDNCAMQLRRR